jgi:hypothetical protein
MQRGAVIKEGTGIIHPVILSPSSLAVVHGAGDQVGAQEFLMKPIRTPQKLKALQHSASEKVPGRQIPTSSHLKCQPHTKYRLAIRGDRV